MYQRHELGKVGEDLAVLYLKREGYQIIGRNFRYKKYEIDIIAKYNNELIFIEVKTRSSNIYGRPIDAVNMEKQKNICRAAKYYLYIHKKENAYVRIDVIEVYFYNHKYYINHIKQVI